MKQRARQAFCPFCQTKLPKKFDYREEIIKAIRSRPDLSYQRIADEYDMSKITVIRYAREAGIRRPQKNGLFYAKGK